MSRLWLTIVCSSFIVSAQAEITLRGRVVEASPALVKIVLLSDKHPSIGDPTYFSFDIPGLEEEVQLEGSWSVKSIEDELVIATPLGKLGTLPAEGYSAVVKTSQPTKKLLSAEMKECLQKGDSCYFSNQRNCVEAFKWYKKAADLGNPAGQTALANLYLYGEGVKQDYAMAFELFTQAANQGYSLAQNNLGGLYENGWGTAIDLVQAKHWYLKSAEQGNHCGEYNAGRVYELGIGCKQNYAEAFQWYKKSAEKGMPKAENALGEFYQYGKGTPQNLKAATTWYQLAAEKGNTDAKDHLKTLSKQPSGDYNLLSMYTQKE